MSEGKPEWLRRLMERDPMGTKPVDDLTAHRMKKSLQEMGKKESARKERMMSLLWPRWGLVQHPGSYYALALAMPIIEDMRLSGELAALQLAALCNFTMLRFADLKPDWGNAPGDLLERITGSYHPDFPEADRVSIDSEQYQYVAVAVGLPKYADWPELDLHVREICSLTYGSDNDEQLLAEKLYEVAWMLAHP